MYRKFIIALMLAALLFPASAYAAEYFSALDFITGESLLEPHESARMLIESKISDGDDEYWVVPVFIADSFTEFIGVKYDLGDFLPADGDVTLRSLFKTGYIMLNYESIKTQLAQDAEKWLFSTVNVQFMLDLSNALGNESFDLATVRNELTASPELQSDVDLLQSQLTSLKTKAAGLAVKITIATDFEFEFFRNPGTGEINSLKTQFNDTFALLAGLKSAVDTYESDLDKLRQKIATLDFDVQTKQSLNSLIASPDRLRRIPTFNTNATLLQSRIETIYSDGLSKAPQFASGFESRIERNTAYKAMYVFNSSLFEKTDGTLTILIDAYESLLADDQTYLWKDQESVQSLRENWKLAEQYFADKKYSLAVESAGYAEKNAIDIYKLGIQEPEETGINVDLLINGAVLIIVLIIIIYALRNRGRLASVVSKGDTEVEIGGWENR